MIIVINVLHPNTDLIHDVALSSLWEMVGFNRICTSIVCYICWSSAISLAFWNAIDNGLYSLHWSTCRESLIFRISWVCRISQELFLCSWNSLITNILSIMDEMSWITYSMDNCLLLILLVHYFAPPTSTLSSSVLCLQNLLFRSRRLPLSFPI